MKKKSIAAIAAICLLLFPVPFSAAADKDLGIQVEELARTGKSWDGSELPSYPEGKPEIRILSITIPPGKKLAVHRHPVINAGVLITGRLRLHTAGGRVLDLKAGEAIVEVVWMPGTGGKPWVTPRRISSSFTREQWEPPSR